jgi:hypothetical protein
MAVGDQRLTETNGNSGAAGIYDLNIDAAIQASTGTSVDCLAVYTTET